MKPKSLLHHKRWTLRLFEWGVLACVVLILAGVFLRRVHRLEVQAERINLQLTYDNLRVAVVLAGILPRENAGKDKTVQAGCNPASLLKGEAGVELPNYLGELARPAPNTIAPGHWYFDRSHRALVYRLVNTEGFISQLAGPARVRFCVRDNVEDENGGGSFRLTACEPYVWH